jgi:hypothetical protein
VQGIAKHKHRKYIYRDDNNKSDGGTSPRKPFQVDGPQAAKTEKSYVGREHVRRGGDVAPGVRGSVEIFI